MEPASAFCHSASTLCVSVLFGVVCPLSLLISYKSEYNIGRGRAASQAVCSSLPAQYYGWGYTQFVCCLLESRARRVSSRGSCLLCECLSLRMLALGGLSSKREPSPAFLVVPARICRGGAAAALVGIADGSGGGNGDWRAPIFFLYHQIQRLLSGIGSSPHGFFPRREGSTLRLSSSEEVDVEDVAELS